MSTKKFPGCSAIREMSNHGRRGREVRACLASRPEPSPAVFPSHTGIHLPEHSRSVPLPSERRIRGCVGLVLWMLARSTARSARTRPAADRRIRPPRSAAVDFFETSVRPVLVESCSEVPRAREAVVGPAARQPRGHPQGRGQRPGRRAGQARREPARPGRRARRTTNSRCPPRGSCPSRRSRRTPALGRDGAPWAEAAVEPRRRPRPAPSRPTGRSSRSGPSPRRPSRTAAGSRTPVDAFILARLEQEG